MEFLSEKENSVVDFEVEITKDEKDFLMQYADDNLTADEFSELMINWSIVDILSKQVDKYPLPKEEDKSYQKFDPFYYGQED